MRRWLSWLAGVPQRFFVWHTTTRVYINGRELKGEAAAVFFRRADRLMQDVHKAFDRFDKDGKPPT